MKKTATIIVFTVAAAGMFFAGRGCGHISCLPLRAPPSVRIDTLIVRDTLRDTVLVPVERFVVRVDTVWLPAAQPPHPGMAPLQGGGTPATDSVQVAVPVERKTYLTPGYRAVVEGFRPSLVEMELYRRTALITREAIRALPASGWGIGIQAGYGFTPHGAAPYFGIGIQYRILAW